jgi:hypothetical protein
LCGFADICTGEVLRQNRRLTPLLVPPYLVHKSSTLPSLAPSFILFFQLRQSQRFRVSHDHGAATGCCTAYFDQNIAKRRVEAKLEALVQHVRCPENPANRLKKPRAVCAPSRESERDSSSKCPPQERTASAVVAASHHACSKPSVIY